MPGFGHDHYIQIGREATWGTDLAATRKLLVVSTDLQPVVGKVRSDVLVSSRNRASIFAGPQMAKATIELEADFEGQLHIWDAAFGTATFGANGGTVTGGGPYVWTFVQRALLNSYVLESVLNIPTGKCEQVVGAKLNKLRFSGSPGLESKPCHIITEWIGKTYSNNVTPTGALSANSRVPIMPGHLDTATLDTGTADAAGSDRLKSWEISIDNKLAERYFGGTYIDEPLADDFAETQVKWTMEFTSKTAIDEYLAHTAGSPSIKFLATATRYLTFSMGAGYTVTPIGRPINRWGIYTQEFTFEAVDDAGSPSTGLTLLVGTTEGTIT